MNIARGLALYIVIGGTLMSTVSIAEDPITEIDIDKRETLILGKPPRIEPLGPDDYNKETQQMVAEIRSAIGAPASGEMPEYFATLMRHPELLRNKLALGMMFFNGELSLRDRELAILRVAWLNQAPYEWGEHVKAGKREAKLTSEEIERVTIGSSAPEWSDDDAAILKAVEELHVDAMISDETWGVLSSRLNEKQLLELPLLIGTYQGTAYLQNSVRFRLMEGNQGLRSR